MRFPGYSYHKQFFLFIALASIISAPPLRKILAAPLLALIICFLITLYMSTWREVRNFAWHRAWLLFFIFDNFLRLLICRGWHLFKCSFQSRKFRTPLPMKHAHPRTHQLPIFIRLRWQVAECESGTTRATVQCFECVWHVSDISFLSFCSRYTVLYVLEVSGQRGIIA